MFKTHERSRFEVMNGQQIRDPGRIIVQIAEEKLYTNMQRMACFLCETVSKADFDLSTLEAKLAEVEKQLEDEAEAYRVEVQETEAKVEALEELLAEASDDRERMIVTLGEVREENMKVYNALTECRRIFGELPPEIEELLGRGEE